MSIGLSWIEESPRSETSAVEVAPSADAAGAVLEPAAGRCRVAQLGHQQNSPAVQTRQRIARSVERDVRVE
jgi:hypothetical protein